MTGRGRAMRRAPATSFVASVERVQASRAGMRHSRLAGRAAWVREGRVVVGRVQLLSRRRLGTAAVGMPAGGPRGGRQDLAHTRVTAGRQNPELMDGARVRPAGARGARSA
jgi:hypothetical protein